MNWEIIIQKMLETPLGGITKPFFIFGFVFCLLGLTASYLVSESFFWIPLVLVALGSLQIVSVIIIFVWLCVKNIDKLG